VKPLPLKLATALLLFASGVSQAADECVALLHGLWRTERSMEHLAEHLAAAGYEIHNVAYDSTRDPIEALAEDTLPRAVEACGEARKVNFVSHSMGGILLRHYLESHSIDNLGRVVMLAPPNQGSEVIDRYGDMPGFEWFSGPAGLQLGTGQDSVPRSLGPVRFDLGIIAGTQTINPILSATLPGEDDGKVSVASTRVDGMQDHLQLPVTHVFMMRDHEVMEQVLYYLQNGRFQRTQAEPVTAVADGAARPPQKG
jgi:triacylglycerol lipase